MTKRHAAVRGIPITLIVGLLWMECSSPGLAMDTPIHNSMTPSTSSDSGLDICIPGPTTAFSTEALIIVHAEITPLCHARCILYTSIYSDSPETRLWADTDLEIIASNETNAKYSSSEDHGALILSQGGRRHLISNVSTLLTEGDNVILTRLSRDAVSSSSVDKDMDHDGDHAMHMETCISVSCPLHGDFDKGMGFVCKPEQLVVASRKLKESDEENLLPYSTSWVKANVNVHNSQGKSSAASPLLHGEVNVVQGDAEPMKSGELSDPFKDRKSVNIFESLKNRVNLRLLIWVAMVLCLRFMALSWCLYYNSAHV